jgi:hypothetical protein
LNRQFSEEVIMASTSIKKFWTFLTIKEMYVTTTLRFHLTPVRMTVIKNQTMTNSCEDVMKKEPSYTVIGNVHKCHHHGNQNGGSLKKRKLKTAPPNDPAIPLLGIEPKECKSTYRATPAHPCSWQHYSQKPSYGISIGVQWPMNG